VPELEESRELLEAPEPAVPQAGADGPGEQPDEPDQLGLF
jgi:hypothetical protein